MAISKVRLKAWFDKKITEPLVQILRRGAEPKQLSFSAALGVTIGVFPICGVTVLLCGVAIALLGSLCHAPTVMLFNFIATPIELSLMVPFLRLGEKLTGGPHFPLTSDALKKVFTGQASREVFFSIGNALLGWLIATPFVIVGLYILFLPCFKILVRKFSSVSPTAKSPISMHSDFKSNNSNPENYSSSSGVNSPELKLYQAFIFSVPICFTFIILFVFYVIYLRRGSADLSSLGMRTTFLPGNSISTAELGLSKELREMLPIVVFKESFFVMDSQCSVCLGDYQADDKLQQIPACGHTFHMDCIDLWLTSHTTCPLCRLTLIPTQSHQSQEDDPPVPSLRTPDGGVSSDPEPQPDGHGNDVQEQQCDLSENDRDAESSKETQEDERNIIGTSSGGGNCTLG
ncbi:hypothetical protein IGI04_035828 [Brassica rapa subsp. trilocularis]|uniref:RING-type domain-containing protein n=1 Tax=Brassica rapa subsp. trilocularis TaxID=1813537 RepID=A0ABQ7LFU5_BRACM|nr:hypothetical protein IGI04_035828 [Brassica rapa subsp. trilocularis]